MHRSQRGEPRPDGKEIHEVLFSPAMMFVTLQITCCNQRWPAITSKSKIGMLAANLAGVRALGLRTSQHRNGIGFKRGDRR
jgi:hypothetical protein